MHKISQNATERAILKDMTHVEFLLYTQNFSECNSNVNSQGYDTRGSFYFMHKKFLRMQLKVRKHLSQ